MDKVVDTAQLTTLMNELIGQLTQFGLSALAAIAILIAGYIIAKRGASMVRERLGRLEKFDQTLTPILAQVLHYTVLLFTGVLVLAQFGIQTTSIIAILGAAGLAIGLALQGTLQNVAAGLMLLLIRPFRVGDWIEAAGVSGAVDEIGLFMTRLHNFEDIFVAVPNSKIWSDTIINYTKRPRRRLVIDVGISYDDDIDHAVKVLTAMLKADNRILDKPDPPRVIVKSYGESSINLQIRAWAKVKEYWDVRFDILRAVKYELDRANITIPYPHRQVIVQSDSKETPAIAPAKTLPKSNAKRRQGGRSAA